MKNYNKYVILLVVSILISISFVGCTKIEDIVAEVNGIKITKSEFDYRKAVLEFQNNREVTNGEVLRLLVVNKLLGEESKKRGASISDTEFQQFISEINFDREITDEIAILIESLGFESYEDFYTHPVNLAFMRNESDMWRLRDLIYLDIEKEYMQELYNNKPIEEITQDEFDLVVKNINEDVNKALDDLAISINNNYYIMIYPEARSSDFYLHELHFRIPNKN